MKRQNKKKMSVRLGLEDDIKVLSMTLTFQIPANTSVRQVVCLLDSIGLRPAELQFQEARPVGRGG
jgi:hypothetical protein